MNTERDMHPATEEAGAAAPVDAETRLALNRDVVRHRLAQAQADRRSGVSDTLNELAGAALPIARETVRQHPYASLAGAALAGALLVRLKPWRRLAGSVLAGWLTRQALAVSGPARGHALDWLMAAARARRKSTPPV